MVTKASVPGPLDGSAGTATMRRTFWDHVGSPISRLRTGGSMRPARCVTLGVLLACFLLTAAPLATSAQGEPDANKAIIRQLYAAYNRGDWAALDPIVAADIVDHDPSPGQVPGR